MKDQEEFEDYLVDKAKELLNQDTKSGEEIETPGKPEKPEFDDRNELAERADDESTKKIPTTWDPREVEKLSRDRVSMDNEELEDFMQKNAEFQEEMNEIDEWRGFSRWEERLLIQRHEDDAEVLAEELGREKKEVKLKLHMLGLKSYNE